jgi:hypothetical protein
MQQIADSPADIKDAYSTLENIKYGDKNHQPQINKTDHPKVWTHGLILTLKAIPKKEIEHATPSLVRWAELIPQKKIKHARLPQAQSGLKPTLFQKGNSNELPEGWSGLKPTPPLK